MVQELRNTSHLAESLNFNLLLKKIIFFSDVYVHRMANSCINYHQTCRPASARVSACLSINHAARKCGNLFILYFHFQPKLVFRKWIGICEHTTSSRTQRWVRDQRRFPILLLLSRAVKWVVLPSRVRSSLVEGYTRENQFAFALKHCSSVPEANWCQVLMKGFSTEVNMFSHTLR